MNLLVDIGNSRIKWCLATGSDPGEVAALEHGRDTLPGALEHAWQGQPVPDRILACSVAGPVLDDAVAALAERLWCRRPGFLAAVPEQLGVRNAYQRPGNLGPDRWAALLGAWCRGLAPCCIVDAGTAVTVDVLDAGGRHWGGMIFAGLALSRHALTERTHRLPVVEDGLLPPLAADTPEAIRLGTREALIGSVERMLREIGHRYGDMRIVLTGGDAPLLAEALDPENVDVIPGLLFHGLAAVLEQRP